MIEIDMRLPKPRVRPDQCHPVVLANGEAFLIPRPHWRIQPRFENGKVVETTRRFGYSNRVDDLVGVLAETDDPEVIISIVATLAATLLRWSYKMTEDDLDGLLHFRADDIASIGWVRSVIDVVTFAASTLPPMKDDE